MSKTAKAKNRQPSIHSRAARRATSPSLAGNVDKSLKDIQPPKRSSHTHLFSGARDAGIRKKKGKQLKRGQLERQKKGVERADIVKGQLESRLEKSLGRLKTIKNRRKDWEVLNADAEAAMGQASKFSVLDGAEDEDLNGRDWVDEPQDGEQEKNDDEMKVELPVRSVAVDQPDLAAPSEQPQEEDDVVE